MDALFTAAPSAQHSDNNAEKVIKMKIKLPNGNTIRYDILFALKN